MQALKTLGFEPAVLAMNIFGFLILLWVFKRFLYGPIAEFMATRAREIEAHIEDAKKMYADAHSQHGTLQADLAAEREAGRAEIAKMTQEAKAAIAELQAEGRKQRAEMVEQGRLEIERSKDSALAELKSTVADMAVEISAKVIRESMNEQRQAALVDEFLRDVEAAGKQDRAN
ncbi:MAG: F0F1 ATP synthase subunit B [Armatimonadota bacterium]